MLLAPDFLFRLEFDPPGARAGSVHPVSDFELASRLSFFLWSSIPDDDLLDCSRQREAADPTVLDGRCGGCSPIRAPAALADNFAAQWLGLRGLARYRAGQADLSGIRFGAGGRRSRRRRACLSAVSFRENRSVLDLLGADYTYLNETLAKLYGIAGVTGPGFRRVSLQGSNRARRTAHPRQHPAADLPCGHGTSPVSARQMDSRQSAEFAASPASGQRAAAR